MSLRATKNSRAGLESAPVADHLIHTFTVCIKSKLDGKVYEGQFTTKKMSIRDIGQLGVIKSRLNGGYYFDEDSPGVGIDETTDATNNMLAHFEVCLLQHPVWWNLDELFDLQLLSEVYKKIVEFENSFFRPERPQESNRDERSGSGDRQGEEPQSRTVGSIAEVGGGQVPASLDP